MTPPCRRSPADDADAAAVVLDETECEVLIEHHEPLLDALAELLVEHLDQDMAGDVGREHRAGRAGRAERPLVELALLVPREHAAPVLELVDVVRRLTGEDLDRVLVTDVVGALHGVERVNLRAVLGLVPERRVDPPLGRAGVAAGWMELRHDRDAGACVMGFDRGAHAGAAGADDEHVEGRVHRLEPTECRDFRDSSTGVERKARASSNPCQRGPAAATAGSASAAKRFSKFSRNIVASSAAFAS